MPFLPENRNKLNSLTKHQQTRSMNENEHHRWIVPTLMKNRYAQQIEDLIVTRITRGILQPGESLPSCQKLAHINGIHRNTVSKVYQSLSACGWLHIGRGGKTLVAEHPPIPRGSQSGVPDRVPANMRPRQEVLAVPAPQNKRDYVMIGPQQLNETYLSYKLIDKHSRSHIRSRINAAQIELLRADRAEPLANPVCGYLNQRGFSIGLQNLQLIRGKGAAVARLLQLLLPPQSTIINTVLGCQFTEYMMQQSGHTIIEFDITRYDALSQLDALLNKQPIKAMYIRPGCSFLKAHTVDEATCLALIALSRKHRFYLIEDDDDHEFWYKAEPFRSLINYENDGQVVYCGALSRLHPYLQNLRTIVAPAEIIAMLKNMPGSPHEYRDHVMEVSIEYMLRSGELQKLVRQTRQQKQRDLMNMHEILKTQLHEFIRYKLPDHGTSVWIRFLPQVNLKLMLDMLERKGVQVPYFPEKQLLQQHVHHMRLDFSQYIEEECYQAAINLRQILHHRIR